MRRSLFLTVFLFVSVLNGVSAQPYELLKKANSLYSQAEFQSSLELYEKVLEEGFENGELFYNLGNAYFKTGKLGRAILNYDKAAKFMPRDPDLRANLRYAFQKAELTPGKRGIFSGLAMLFTNTELETAFFIFYYLLAVILCFSFFLRKKPAAMRYLLMGVSLCAFFSAALFAYNTYNTYFVVKGVILADGAECRFEPNLKSAVFFRFNEGEQIVYYERSDGWLRIERGDGSVGWVKQEAVGII